MYDWHKTVHKTVQSIIDEIDRCIKENCGESLTLSILSRKFGYSEYHFSRMFKEISGMRLRDYMRYRRLAFALKRVRDTDEGLLDIALDSGFSSHEAFTRAFREAYGVTPHSFRKNPRPVVLRTIIKPFDCYLMEHGGFIMNGTNGEVKTYFITIPAHKFLHIRN